jgi:hypothetical protein
MEKYKNYELVQMYNNLESITGLQGVELLVARSHNRKVLKGIANTLTEEEASPKSLEYIAFEKAESDLNIKFATDSKGLVKTKLVNIGGKDQEVYDLDVTDEKYLAARSELYKKNKDILDLRIEQTKKYVTYMNSEYKGNLDLMYIPASFAPSNQSQFDAIEFMIKPFTSEQENQFKILFSELK